MSLQADYIEILCDYAYGLRTIMSPGEYKLIPGAPRLYAEKKLVGDGVRIYNQYREHEKVIDSDHARGRGRTPWSAITLQNPLAELSVREMLISTILLARITGTHDYYAAIELGSPEFEAALTLEQLS